MKQAECVINTSVSGPPKILHSSLFSLTSATGALVAFPLLFYRVSNDVILLKSTFFLIIWF